MIFNSITLSEMQTRIVDTKAAYTPPAYQPETVRMVNGTLASLYSISLGRLVSWPYGDAFQDDHIDRFLTSNQACGPVLYHFLDGSTALYIGKALRGYKRSLDHIYARGSHNQALHRHLVDNQPRSLSFTIVYYALALSPDLPPELTEGTILLCESTLIKRNPTKFNIHNN